MKLTSKMINSWLLPSTVICLVIACSGDSTGGSTGDGVMLDSDTSGLDDLSVDWNIGDGDQPDSAVEDLLPDTPFDVVHTDHGSDDMSDGTIPDDLSADESPDDMSLDPELAEVGEPGRISIYLTGDLTERTFEDELYGQTPRDYFIALSAYYVLTSGNDISPDLCFEHGDRPVTADLYEDNLMGSCVTATIPTDIYTHGRVRVDWMRYTVDGTLHYLDYHLPGEFVFFRAYSNTTYGTEFYLAGTGYIEFRGATIIRIPTTSAYTIDLGGVQTELIDGEFWMTFPYRRTLPIDSTSPDNHWARFHWEIYEAFRWEDLDQDNFSEGEWDVTSTIYDGEQIHVPGVTGYHVTASID